MKLFALLLIAAPMALAQISMPWHECSAGGSCHSVHSSVVMDVNWGLTNNAQYKDLGVTVSGDSVRMNFLTEVNGKKNIGSRFYLLANDSSYTEFKLLAKEFTFDTDISTIECGMNAALYLISMDADGGHARYPEFKGAKYGSGYCDAQCPNVGGHRSCCDEMDIWEANNAATVFTPHPCANKDRCDSGGCGYNAYSHGARDFYGPGKKVDTKKVFTVVTQFITTDGTPHGVLKEIRQLYVQDGKVLPGSQTTHVVNEAGCNWSGSFRDNGGLKKMGEAIQKGMVLAFSLWDDHGGNMEWLDTGNNGPCPTGHNANELESKYPHAYTTFSNIRVGPIGSTYKH